MTSTAEAPNGRSEAPPPPPVPPAGADRTGRRRRLAVAVSCHRRGSVPDRLRLLRAAVFLACAALAAVLVTGGVSASGAWSDIRQRSAPQVTSATGLYFTINDMDAQLANQLMAGDSASVAGLRKQSAQLYDQRRGEAAAYLSDLAQAARGDRAAERNVAAAISDLGAYEEHGARALMLADLAHTPAGHADPEAVAEYAAASRLMRTRLLPEADHLVTANNAAFEGTYTGARGTQSDIRTALVVTAVVLLALLVALQVYLTSRFRRVVNPGAAAATALVLATLVIGLVQVSGQRDHLRAARRDAFDSVVAGRGARASSRSASSSAVRDTDRAGGRTAGPRRLPAEASMNAAPRWRGSAPLTRPIRTHCGEAGDNRDEPAVSECRRGLLNCS